MKRAAARRASATGGCLAYATGRPASFPQLAIGAGGSGVVPHPSSKLCIRSRLSQHRPCETMLPFLSTEHLIFLLNLLNTSAALLVPCAIMLHTKAELLPGFALTMAVSRGRACSFARQSAVGLLCCMHQTDRCGRAPALGEVMSLMSGCSAFVACACEQAL